MVFISNLYLSKLQKIVNMQLFASSFPQIVVLKDDFDFVFNEQKEKKIF